jgi:hypothetical protein
MNGQADANRQHERETFEAFCDAVRLLVVPGSFRQSDQPALDIAVDLIEVGAETSVYQLPPEPPPAMDAQNRDAREFQHKMRRKV